MHYYKSNTSRQGIKQLKCNLRHRRYDNMIIIYNVSEGRLPDVTFAASTTVITSTEFTASDESSEEDTKERVPGWAIGVIVGMAVLVVVITISFIIYVSSTDVIFRHIPMVAG